MQPTAPLPRVRPLLPLWSSTSWQCCQWRPLQLTASPRCRRQCVTAAAAPCLVSVSAVPSCLLASKQPAPCLRFRPADKLVIQLDRSDAPLMEFWRATNPAAVAVAEGKGGEAATAFVCQVGRDVQLVAVYGSQAPFWGRNAAMLPRSHPSLHMLLLPPPCRTLLARRPPPTPPRWRSCCPSRAAAAPPSPRPSRCRAWAWDAELRLHARVDRLHRSHVVLLCRLSSLTARRRRCRPLFFLAPARFCISFLSSATL